MQMGTKQIGEGEQTLTKVREMSTGTIGLLGQVFRAWLFSLFESTFWRLNCIHCV